MERIDSLNKVFNTVTLLGNDEANFSKIEELRKQEFSKVWDGKEPEFGSYAFNLRETGDKQAKEYKEARRRLNF